MSLISQYLFLSCYYTMLERQFQDNNDAKTKLISYNLCIEKFKMRPILSKKDRGKVAARYKVVWGLPTKVESYDSGGVLNDQ